MYQGWKAFKFFRKRSLQQENKALIRNGKMQIAYSEYFKSHITPSRIISNDNWYFILCTEDGILPIAERTYRAGSSFDCFNWKEIPSPYN